MARVYNKNTWLTYMMKLMIGYYGSKDTDGCEMSKEISEYIGVNYEECDKKYKSSLAIFIK